MKTSVADRPGSIERERHALLRQIERASEIPMLVLGFAWLALLIVELTAGLGWGLEAAGLAIWMIFVLDFALKFILAPRKLLFLRRQWLTALSLLLPALRVFRLFRVARLLRVARATRGIRLFRLVASINRGLRALRSSMRRRGVGYVLALATLVAFAGAAGMYAFEHDQNPGLPTYGAALWWTAMMMTTVASDYFPRTPEGRILCFLLATVAFALWGYLTASLATFFVGRDTAPARPAGGEDATLRAEVRALRAAVEALTAASRDRKDSEARRPEL